MSRPVTLQAELVGVEPTAIAPAAQPASDLVLMFERLVRDPTVDVGKLQQLIDMQKEILRVNAEAAFYAAFSEMQGELPEIDEKGRIVVEGQVRSTYAKNEDIQAHIRPILKRHGFALSFRERAAENGKMKIIGILSHRGGHREEDEFAIGADDSGKKNAIQARGSSRSYGQRYTTIFLLNISTREVGFGADDDGGTSEKHKAPAAPDGYEPFIAALDSLSGDGFKAVSEAWNKSKPEFRNYATKHDKGRWESIRAKAQKAGK